MACSSTPSASSFLSFSLSITGKSFSDKELNVVHKEWEADEKWSSGVRFWKMSKWMKLSVMRARLMHYVEDRIARFSVPLIDWPQINYLKVYAGAISTSYQEITCILLQNTSFKGITCFLLNKNDEWLMRRPWHNEICTILMSRRSKFKSEKRFYSVVLLSVGIRQTHREQLALNTPL